MKLYDYYVEYTKDNNHKKCIVKMQTSLFNDYELLQTLIRQEKLTSDDIKIKFYFKMKRR